MTSFKFRKLPPGEPFTPFEAKYLVDCPQCGTTWSMARRGHRCLWIQPFSDSMYEFGRAIEAACVWDIQMHGIINALLQKQTDPVVLFKATAKSASFWWDENALDPKNLKHEENPSVYPQPYDMVTKFT